MKRIVIFTAFFLILFFSPSCGPSSNGASAPQAGDSPPPTAGPSAPPVRYMFSGTLSEWSKRFDVEGLRLYEEKKYGEAAKFFRLAVLADVEDIQPHYHLALTLAKQGGGANSSNVGECLDELAICRSLDPARAGLPHDWIQTRLKEEPALESVRALPEFQALAEENAEPPSFSPADLLPGLWRGKEFAWAFSGTGRFRYQTAWGSSSSEYDTDRSGEFKLELSNDVVSFNSYDHRVDSILVRGPGRRWGDKDYYLRKPAPTGGRIDWSKYELTVEIGGERFVFSQQENALLKSCVDDSSFDKVVSLLTHGVRWDYPGGFPKKIRPAMKRLLEGWGNKSAGAIAMEITPDATPRGLTGFLSGALSASYARSLDQMIEDLPARTVESPRTASGKTDSLVQWNRYFPAGWSAAYVETAVLFEESFYGEAGSLYVSVIAVNAAGEGIAEERVLEARQAAIDHPAPNLNAFKAALRSQALAWITFLEKYRVRFDNGTAVGGAADPIHLDGKDYTIFTGNGTGFQFGLKEAGGGDVKRLTIGYDCECGIAGWMKEESSGAVLAFIELVIDSELAPGFQELRIHPYVSSSKGAEPRPLAFLADFEFPDRPL